MQLRKKKHGLYIALLFFIAITDRVTKIIALPSLNQGVVILNDSLFSLIHLPRIYALALAGILFFICFIWLLNAQRNRISYIPLLYILLGMGSNGTDRIVYGGVVDWIRFPGVSVFNIADVCIIVGVFFLFINLLRGK